MNILHRRALSFITSWLDFRARQVDVPGISVAIYDNDRICLSRTYGYKDLGEKAILRRTHLLRAASLSKLYAATAIMQLHERGKLSLNHTIARYLPWVKKLAPVDIQRITVQQLLIHSSGLVRDGERADFWHGIQSFPNEEGLRSLVLGSELYHNQNGVSKYSNLAYGLLGEVVSRVSGMTYAEYFQKHIIQPLDLQRTFPDYASAIDGQMATGYSRVLEGFRRPLAKDITTKALMAAGGVCTTAEDLCLFMASRFTGDGRILSEESKKLIHTKHTPISTNPQKDGYRGFGCAVVPVDDRTYIRNIGSFPGHHCIVMSNLERRLVVTVFTTSNDAVDKEIMDGIISILHYFEDHATRPPNPQLLRFEGRFLSARGVDEFVAVDEGLIAIQSNSWLPFSAPEHLELLSSNTFRIKKARHSDYAEGELVTFNRSNKGGEMVIYTGKTLWPEKVYLQEWTGHEN